MSPENRQGTGTVLFLVCLFLGTPCLAAAPLNPEGGGVPSVQKVRKALEQPLNLEIQNSNLRQAVEQLREQCKVNFVLDTATLNQSGIDEGETPVHLHVQNGTVRTALRKLLSQHNLGFAIIQDFVLITSEEMAVYRQVRQPVDVHFQQSSLAAALDKLAAETGTNLLLDSRLGKKEGQTEVTLKLMDVPLEVAVRLLAEMAGLKMARLGNVLFVTSRTTALELRSEPDNSRPPVPGIGGQPEDAVPPAVRGMPGPPPAVVPAPPPPLPVPFKPEKPGEGKKAKDPT